MISIPFIITVLTLSVVVAMACLALNVEAGWGGMWDLGVAGHLAFGAYAYALLTGAPDSGVPGLGLPILAGMLGAGLLTGLAAVVIGWPTLRLRGEYFLITTFGFAEIIRQMVVIQRDHTGGTFGITAIKKPFADQITFQAYPYALLAVIVAMTAFLAWMCHRIAASSFGLTLRAARDNEPLAMAMGKGVARMRLATYAFVGVTCGLLVAPAYTWFLGALVPSIFTSHLTFIVWTALVIGGLGSRWGGVIGAAVLIMVSEFVRLIPVEPENAQRLAAVQPLLVGVLLIALLRWRPAGLMSERSSFRRIRRRGTPNRNPNRQQGPQLVDARGA